MKFIDPFAGMGGFRLGLESINGSKDTGSKNNTKELSEDRKRLVSKKGKTTTSTSRRVNEQSYQNGNERAFTCVWSNEWDKYCAKIYEKNFGEKPDTRDIRIVPSEEIPDHDLLCAGFPCQSFSIAGQRKGFRDTRGTLFFEICRILKDKRPSYLLLENVKGLLSHQDGWTFATMLLSLDELGYDVEWQVLNSKHFGVPQNRERVFIVGYLRESRIREIFPIRAYNKKDVSTYRTQQGSRKRIWNSDNKKNGQDKQNASGQRQGIWGTSIRRLTPIECERLQGFPDNWTEGVSNTQRYKMLGNAVTVNVIQAIGEKLLWKT